LISEGGMLPNEEPVSKSLTYKGFDPLSVGGKGEGEAFLLCSRVLQSLEKAYCYWKNKIVIQR